jgi:hypothetical protein
MTLSTFKNKHLSYSRLERYLACPMAFRLHYIDKLQAEPWSPCGRDSSPATAW